MADGDLCEIDDVLAWLPTQPGQSAEPLLARLITAASRAVCNYCGRGQDGFAVTAYTDLCDGSGREFILLRQWPVVAVQSISLSDAWGAVYPAISDPTAFLLEQSIPSGGNQRLTLLGGHRFPRGRSNVQVAYSAGYDVVPFDVAQVCIELVGEAYRRRERIGQNSVAQKDGSTVSFSQADMNASIKAMLSPYRRLVPC